MYLSRRLSWAFSSGPAMPLREGKSVHDHHRKKIIWGTFLASKENFPGRWWTQKSPLGWTTAQREDCPRWAWPIAPPWECHAAWAGEDRYPKDPAVLKILRRSKFTMRSKFSECAKGAAKALCGETVVQKGVFGESVSTLPP